MVKSLSILLALIVAAAPLARADIRVEVTDPKHQPVADAVASLTPLDATTPPALTPPANPVVISQIDEEFSPYVTAIVAGTRVSFPNRDAIQHHVYSLSKTKSFELPLYKGETHDPLLFDQPGVVTLGCNIHDWMSAHIVVLATPHFAKTAADGLAPLAAVPAGRYRLEVWHPRIPKTVTRDVVIDPSDPSTQTITVTLRPDRRIRRAPDSGPVGYR